jgi:hypothetical protein
MRTNERQLASAFFLLFENTFASLKTKTKQVKISVLKFIFKFTRIERKRKE